MRRLGEPLADIGGEMAYRFFQAAFDPLVTGLCGYWKSPYLNELSDEAIDLITERGAASSCSDEPPKSGCMNIHSGVEWFIMGLM